MQTNILSLKVQQINKISLLYYPIHTYNEKLLWYESIIYSIERLLGHEYKMIQRKIPCYKIGNKKFEWNNKSRLKCNCPSLLNTKIVDRLSSKKLL